MNNEHAQMINQNNHESWNYRTESQMKLACNKQPNIKQWTNKLDRSIYQLTNGLSNRPSINKT